jgi:CDP-glucose 4,6-dehydratase
LSGYLLVGQRLLLGDTSISSGWNFGPRPNDILPVRDVVKSAQDRWPTINYNETPSTDNPHEAHLLRLDCTKAHEQLDWYPVWDMQTTIARTIDWYQAYYEQSQLFTQADLDAYVNQARAANLIWTR